MGMFKDVKAATIGSDARKAREDGHRYFAPLINSPATHSGLTGPVGGWAEMLEAVEAEGWMLLHWTVGQDSKGRPQAYPLFGLR